MIVLYFFDFYLVLLKLLLMRPYSIKHVHSALRALPRQTETIIRSIGGIYELRLTWWLSPVPVNLQFDL